MPWKTLSIGPKMLSTERNERCLGNNQSTGNVPEMGMGEATGALGAATDD
ncbi:hypothetical protein [Microcoleus sp. S36bC1]